MLGGMMSDLQNIKSIIAAQRAEIFSRKNVVATGIGYKVTAGKKTNQLCLICSVIKKEPASKLDQQNLIPAKIENYPTDVQESDEIVAQKKPTERFRPVPGGVSIGHRAVTAGTLGSWVKKDGQYYLLSNNHVIANENLAKKGDAILQPGSYDGGLYPKDAFAELADFVPIKFGTEDNFVDAAIARPAEFDQSDSSCSVAKIVATPLNFIASVAGRKTRLKPVKILAADDFVRDEILEIGKIPGIMEGSLGMKVKKYGRTTQLTSSEITQIDATVKVNYGNQSAWFTDQLITGYMSAGGDSGSLVVSAAEKKAVGLLFAGSDLLTVVNRIQNVVSAFDITFEE